MSRRFAEMFPAWRDVEIIHFWQGLVCLSANLTLQLGSFADDPTVFSDLAYHGNGVATGTWSGRAVARLVVDKDAESRLCAVVSQPLKRFPLAECGCGIYAVPTQLTMYLMNCNEIFALRSLSKVSFVVSYLLFVFFNEQQTTKPRLY